MIEHKNIGMKTMKFKTNLKCPNCVAKVKAGLDTALQVAAWSVNLKDPERILTIETNDPDAAEVVKKILADAGYRSEPIPG